MEGKVSTKRSSTADAAPGHYKPTMVRQYGGRRSAGNIIHAGRSHTANHMISTPTTATNQIMSATSCGCSVPGMRPFKMNQIIGHHNLVSSPNPKSNPNPHPANPHPSNPNPHSKLKPKPKPQQKPQPRTSPSPTPMMTKLSSKYNYIKPKTQIWPLFKQLEYNTHSYSSNSKVIHHKKGDSNQKKVTSATGSNYTDDYYKLRMKSVINIHDNSPTLHTTSNNRGLVPDSRIRSSSPIYAADSCQSMANKSSIFTDHVYDTMRRQRISSYADASAARSLEFVDHGAMMDSRSSDYVGARTAKASIDNIEDDDDDDDDEIPTGRIIYIGHMPGSATISAQRMRSSSSIVNTTSIHPADDTFESGPPSTRGDRILRIRPRQSKGPKVRCEKTESPTQTSWLSDAVEREFDRLGIAYKDRSSIFETRQVQVDGNTT